MHLFWLLITLINLTSAYRRSTSNRHPHLLHRSLLQARSANDVASKFANFTFEQYIDHDQPELGTFPQRYVVDTTYWNGTGSPVILWIWGEGPIEDGLIYFNKSLGTAGLLASEIGAAQVILEHRFFGESVVFDEWTTQNLQYLTSDNAIRDAIRFAKSVQLHFSNVTGLGDVPWIATGESYGGGLVTWLAQLHPDTFWAYYASSATVEVVPDNFGFYVIGEEVFRQNCTKDLQLVAAHIDEILVNGSADQIHDIKALFGMETLKDDVDFVTALGRPTASYFPGDNPGGFCDRIEGGLDAIGGAPATGIGLDKALVNFAAIWKAYWNPPQACDQWYAALGVPNPCHGHANASTCCFDTRDPTSAPWSDTRPDDVYFGRAYSWLQCNEIGMWDTGAPDDRPSIVSRLIVPEYWYAQCALRFPPGPNGETYGWARGITPSDRNTVTGGWNIDCRNRIVFGNGQWDGFRYSTVVSPLRPGGPLLTNGNAYVFDQKQGQHGDDFFVKCGPDEVECPREQDEIRGQLRKFVDEWYSQRIDTAGS
ncbi:unnamed protein product [Zymoseptoria tritici ST99CH_3D7]|uniref:Carboxypeptidase n=1 Tax=Zymoseptoria tritici (strain ST99CH_3D7) TaxID=1276538 RepID=A0A1X7RCP6_ZYMT9|nr:unnamed protein product [Zymoseptoria tritici ST99CH_3D7]